VTLDGGTGGDTLGFLGWGNSYGKAFLGTPSSWEVLLPPPVVLPAPPGPAPGP
jgi:hypothetical protein